MKNTLVKGSCNCKNKIVAWKNNIEIVKNMEEEHAGMTPKKRRD